MLLYIDPGTGSMMFAVIMGLVTTLYFFAQKLLLKVKIWFLGGRSGVVEKNMIPYVIFSDDKRYWEMFRPVCEVFERKKTEIRYWTCSKDDPALSAEYEYVKAEYIGNINAASVRLNSMNAGICIATTPGLDVYQWKRSNNTRWYVHLMHGAGDARGYKMFGLNSFDAVLVAGEHQVGEIKQIEKIYGDSTKEIVVVGEPHIDNLYSRFKKTDAKGEKRFTVLLAPSWGKSAILSKYGEKIIDSLIATGYNVIVRPHPQSMISEKDLMDKLMSKYKETDSFHWNLDNDNFEALNAADIMISDFSSVIWDYMLVFDRPVIYADVHMDNSQYDIAWTGEDRWEIAVLERTGVKLTEADMDGIKKVIDDLVASESMAAERLKVKQQAWANEGKSAEKIAEYLIGKYESITHA